MICTAISSIIYRVAGRGTYPVAEQDRYVNHFGSVEELMALSLDTECEVVSPLALAPGQPGQCPARNRAIAAASAAAIARWTLGVTSSAASAALFMLPVSIRTFGIVVRFSPARSLRLM
jgi:hypothetical protein